LHPAELGIRRRIGHGRSAGRPSLGFRFGASRGHKNHRDGPKSQSDAQNSSAQTASPNRPSFRITIIGHEFLSENGLTAENFQTSVLAKSLEYKLDYSTATNAVKRKASAPRSGALRHGAPGAHVGLSAFDLRPHGFYNPTLLFSERNKKVTAQAVIASGALRATWRPRHVHDMGENRE
jgi:hypothetical protein